MRIFKETHGPIPSIYCQSGLTLLEIMITVVILSLGLLGLAGLQMTGLKNNRNAYYNSVAGQVVQDIAERLRMDATTRNAITVASPRNVQGNNALCATNVASTFDNRVACIASNIPGGRARISVSELNAAGTAAISWYVAMVWTDPQLNGAPGWGAGTTLTNPDRPDTSACGDQVADTNCYYTVFRP